MTQQHQKWIQLVKDKLNSEGMTQTHLARACGVKKPTISELLKYGKGSNRLKNRVCDVLGIDETWVDLGEQKEANMKPKRYPYSGNKKELAKPVQFKNPFELFDQFTTSVLCTAKSNNPEHVRLVIELMQSYSQLYP